MICPFCQHAFADRENYYGIVCQNCTNIIPPAEKSPLTKQIEENKQREADLVRDLLKKKLGGTHANRN